MGQNVLQWSDNANNETGFSIERKAEACASNTLSYAVIAQVGAVTGVGNAGTYTDTAVAEGSTYCYRVAAFNSGGFSAYSNTVERTVPITSGDTTAPTIDLLTPTTGQSWYAKASPLHITGQAADNVLLAGVSWWNETTSGSGSAFPLVAWSVLSDWYADVPLATGANLVHFYAQDTSGNITPRDLLVTLDTLAPTITITSPTPPSGTTTLATVTFSGTATDAVGLAAITWSNNRGGSGTAQGTLTWTIPGASLQPGPNVFTMTATDLAGNQTSTTFTMNYQAVAVTRLVYRRT